MAGDLDAGTVSGRVEFEDGFSMVMDSVLEKLGLTQASAESFGETVQASIEDPLKAAGQVAKDVLTEMGPMGIALAEIGTVAVVTGTAMFELADSAAETGEQILNFARATGDSVDDVSDLSKAAQIGGSSLDSLQTMLFQMQRRLDAGGPSAQKFNASLADLHINAEQFRAADPTERIGMLSEAMHGAAGNTQMMSDAIAIMGRGAVQNMPFLLKNFDELKARGDALAYQWTQTETDAAEEFKFKTREVTTELQTLATTIGVALMPAVELGVEGFARMILAVEHVVDLGGLVSGTWHLITGALGETALSEQTYAAVHDKTVKLWAESIAQSGDLNEATYMVAESMLKLGYNQKVVAEMTGLDADAVSELAGQLKSLNTESAAYDAASSRVNEALAEEYGGLGDVSSSFRGWVDDMIKAKIPMKDMEEVTGLNKTQLGLLEASIKKTDAATEALSKKQAEAAAKEMKDYETAVTDVDTALASESVKLADLDKSFVGWIDDMIKAKVSQKDIAEVTGLSADQVKQLTAELNTQSAALKAQEKAIDEVSGYWTKFYNEQALLGKTDSEKIAIKAEQDYEARIQKLADAGVVDAASYESLNQLRVADTAAGQQQLLIQDQNTRASLDNRLMIAQKTFAEMQAAYGEYSATDMAAQQSVIANLRQQEVGWNAVGSAIASDAGSVTLLSGEVVKLSDEMKMLDAGGSVDVTIQNLAASLDSVVTGNGAATAATLGAQQHGLIGDEGSAAALAKKGYSFAEIVAYLEGGVLPAKPVGPRIPGFRDGGFGDFGEGTLVELHGKEIITPFEKAASMGGDTFNVNMSGLLLDSSPAGKAALQKVVVDALTSVTRGQRRLG